MNKYFLFLILLFSFYSKYSSLIYPVTSLYSLRKSLRILDEEISFLQEVKGDSSYLNYYYTTLYLGKDQSPQVYILDTGSSITTSPCDKCTSCGKHLNQKYKLESENKIIKCDSDRCNLVSNTKCISNQCSFYISYAEGSKISGFYLNEDVYFQTIDSVNNITNISFNIPLGCTTTETHLFQTQLADGIMGLNNNDKSFIGILFKSKVIQKYIFSLCFSHEGGYFAIGQISTSHHYSKNISYVNLINRNMGNYYINLNYVQIGDTKIPYNGKAFVDSGTTLSYFPNQNFEEIMKSFSEICKMNKKCGNLKRIKGLGYCSKLNNEDEIEEIIRLGWSNITLVFDGYAFIWSPKNYFFLYNTKANGLNICLGFEGDKRQNVLLGTTFMHGYDIIFDKDKHRIGFVPADCNRIEKIQKEEENDANIIINLNDMNNKNTDYEDNMNTKNNKNLTFINFKNNSNEEKVKNNKTMIDIIPDNNEINKIIISSGVVENNIKNTSFNFDNIKYTNINISNDEFMNKTDKKIDIKFHEEHKKDDNIKKIPNEINISQTINKINELKIPTDIIKNNNTENNNDFEKKKKYNKKENNSDKLIINVAMFLSLIIFILFIIFNIILLRENYIYIQNRKNDNNLNKYELEVPKEEINNPISFFNDSV